MAEAREAACTDRDMVVGVEHGWWRWVARILVSTVLRHVGEIYR